MREFFSSVSTKGQITLPAEVRSRLGLRPKDIVSIRLEEAGVLVRPAAATLAAGFQSIPPLKTPRGLEEMTEIAADEQAEEAVQENEP